jgi:hypothetical protein
MNTQHESQTSTDDNSRPPTTATSNASTTVVVSLFTLAGRSTLPTLSTPIYHTTENDEPLVNALTTDERQTCHSIALWAIENLQNIGGVGVQIVVASVLGDVPDAAYGNIIGQHGHDRKCLHCSSHSIHL